MKCQHYKPLSFYVRSQQWKIKSYEYNGICCRGGQTDRSMYTFVILLSFHEYLICQTGFSFSDSPMRVWGRWEIEGGRKGNREREREKRDKGVRRGKWERENTQLSCKLLFNFEFFSEIFCTIIISMPTSLFLDAFHEDLWWIYL